jgi:hypothetical protein
VITGTAEAARTVTVMACTPLWRPTAPTRDDPGSGADGPLRVTVTSTDAAGNTATATQTLTVDRGTTVTHHG